MAETAAIAKMADFVSREIFSTFGWERKPHHDLNFDCEFKEHKKKTHPADVVFHYDSPHDPNRIYLNTDLKSYAKDSIKSTSVAEAANNLILAMDCANRSGEWRRRYVGDDENFDVHGLLFVYNHDSGFDEGWSRLLADAKINTRKINGSINHRLYVLGPQDIEYLVSVADDIKRQRGDDRLPGKDECWFYYPDLAIKRVKHNKSNAATMELLTAPWMILGFSGTVAGSLLQGSYCYYRGKGECPEEFTFLIDYLFRTQLVGEKNIITIKCTHADGKASENFVKAKEMYASDHHSLAEFKQRLKRICFEPVARVRTNFSEEVLGMED